ncbi:hypothetical protein, partial [Dyella sp.]|uniref:hypothetical protein n=1 Tax=Dyella sp. TaxID=1869338 RepID=UPI002D7A1700
MKRSSFKVIGTTWRLKQCRKQQLCLGPVHTIGVARVVVEWLAGGSAWRSLGLSAKASRALPHGGHSTTT